MCWHADQDTLDADSFHVNELWESVCIFKMMLLLLGCRLAEWQQSHSAI